MPTYSSTILFPSTSRYLILFPHFPPKDLQLFPRVTIFGKGKYPDLSGAYCILVLTESTTVVHWQRISRNSVLSVLRGSVILQTHSVLNFPSWVKSWNTYTQQLLWTFTLSWRFSRQKITPLITHKQSKILPRDLSLNLPSKLISSEPKQYHSASGIIDKSVTTELATYKCKLQG